MRQSSKQVGVDSQHMPSRLRVELYEPVQRRIEQTLLRTSVEDGGKFLGRIVRRDGQLVIRIETYIDSGPRVDHSASHLHPDGEYQEAVFRLAECLDPGIEHLGSWHSHHCNGLNTLSGGDIRGYIQTVSDPDYGPRYFFVVLVTALERGRAAMRYYLFEKGTQEYVELDAGSVRLVDNVYPWEDVVAASERAAQKARNLPSSAAQAALSHPLPTRRERDTSDALRLLRSKDRAWFARRFPEAQIVQDRRDGTLSWKWPVRLDSETLMCRLRYPALEQTDHAPIGQLEILRGNERLVSTVALDETRFQRIEDMVAQAGTSPDENVARPHVSDGSPSHTDQPSSDRKNDRDGAPY